MNLNLISKIRENKADQKHNTVIAGILEGDAISDNGRFYPRSVVESAIAKLPGRPSLIGHESVSPEDVVAKIERSWMQDKLALAEFRFGTDDGSQNILRKIVEGLVTDVSIRANGDTRSGKVDGLNVQVVETLDIWSVDFVTEGGVRGAKVLKIYESSPIVTLYGSLNEELAEYATARLGSITDELKKEYISGALFCNGKLVINSIEKIDAQISTCTKLFENMERAAASRKSRVDLVINPVDSQYRDDPKTVDEFLNSPRILREDKKRFFFGLMDGSNGNGKHHTN